MGQAIQAAAADEYCVIGAGIDEGDSPSKCTGNFDAVIDFSHHDATLPLVEWSAQCKLPVVIGTTGHSEQERKDILEFAKTIPIVWSGNYSVGVNLLNYLVEKAAAVLQEGYDPEIIEMHHKHKKDAPSGTAERLLEIVLASRSLQREHLQHGREGMTGARPAEQVGVHAIRGGDIVGEHTVLFAGEGERIELTHKASDRRIFAAGSLRAARWAVTQTPGLYSMQDVLNLKA